MKVIYTAIVLDNASALDKYVPVDWKKFCHHQTIKFGDQTLPLNLGETVEVHAVALYKNDHAVAVLTADGGHITIATNDVPPKYSNELVADVNNKVVGIDIKLTGRIGAFVVEDDDTAHWIF